MSEINVARTVAVALLAVGAAMVAGAVLTPGNQPVLAGAGGLLFGIALGAAVSLWRKP